MSDAMLPLIADSPTTRYQEVVIGMLILPMAFDGIDVLCGRVASPESSAVWNLQFPGLG